MKFTIYSKKYGAVDVQVDEEDCEKICDYRFTFCPGKLGKLYVQGRTLADRRWMYLHRLILGAGPGQLVDHISRDTLDNRKSNLRLSTNSTNMQNACKHKTRAAIASRYKGVCWRKDTKKWMSRIRLDGKVTLLGHFVSEIEAAKAYNVAAIKYFGEFARLNTFDDELDTDKDKG